MCMEHLAGPGKLRDPPLLVSKKMNVYILCVSTWYRLPAMPESPNNKM
jgi:hypothetical protein